MNNTQKHSLWISVIGLPNAGKSTLFNSLMGDKLAIVTPKAQTTRNTIKGIKTVGDCQLVFIDTPGFFAAKKRIDKFMQKSISQALYDSDHILFMHDATRPIASPEEQFFTTLAKNKTDCSLVLNKIDKIDKSKLLELAKLFSNLYEFKHTFMISALKKHGMEAIMNTLTKESGSEGWLFDEDQITTAPKAFLVQETVREKILFNANQEIPYNVFLETDLFKEDKNLVTAYVTIYIDTESRKKILLGSGGSLIKKISTQARKELEYIFKKKVFLKTFIKKQEWEKRLTTSTFVNY